MLLKTSFLFFAASAMVAVSASPVTGTTPAAHSPLFPDTTSANALKIQGEIIKYLEAHAPKPAPKVKRDNTAAVAAIERFGEFANAAYYITSNAWNCPQCTTSPKLADTVVVKFFDKADGPSYGYVARNDRTNEIIVAFRGTKTLDDVWSDAKAVTTDWAGAGSGAKVHTGFNNAYKSAANDILTTIRDIRHTHPNHSIVFVGHSYGGAQASLAAADFVYKNEGLKSQVSLYTYGQPRTGNAAFADWMTRQAFTKYRVTYKSDPISRVPAEKTLLDYKHHSQEVFYSPNNQIKFCSSTNGEDPTCQGSLPFNPLLIKDHSLYPGIREDRQE
ncbi:alpha/beta-hydrolase [Martensiomyces pterosporus]|nr:alpha/beta-hydrolase [Martensiomyces pterosporus]